MATVTEHLEETRDERTNILPPQGPRVWWSGVMSGFFVALAVVNMQMMRTRIFRGPAAADAAPRPRAARWT